MGLFALPMGETPAENVKAAVWNLNEFLLRSKEDDPEFKYDYLLVFAESCIRKAQEQIAELKHKEKE